MTQKQALEIMNSGANVFLTGEPGAGKTYVLNKYLEEVDQRVAVTASTGIAASHIGGMTIHSWAGIGIRDSLTKEDIQYLAGNKHIRKRYKRTDILVIDEVSMLHGFRLDMVNAMAKYIRGSDQPFGGMQVILVGDLFQLPPVTRDSSDFDFAHLSEAWQELDLKICYLTEQHRQSSDDLLLKVLRDMRDDAITHSHHKLLESRMRLETPDSVTKLFSHNIDVDFINQEHLDKLPGQPTSYMMFSDGDKYRLETLKKNVLAPHILDLKKGAEVMFVANNFSEGFFNGSRGKIIKFNKAGDPVVKLVNGRKIAVERHKWAIKEDERVLASVEQLPLRLAWAITIHKSQGMSLDAAEIDLSQAFQPAMGYVALSRVRSLDGLYLQGFNDMALVMHKDIYDFDLELRRLSSKLVADAYREVAK